MEKGACIELSAKNDRLISLIHKYLNAGVVANGKF
jgi:hypothetical protein